MAGDVGSDINEARLIHQRNLANQRERKRMMLINKGFELLRSRLPIGESINNESGRKQMDAEISPKTGRLTKVDILRLTIDYIKQLNKMLTGSVRPDNQEVSRIMIKPSGLSCGNNKCDKIVKSRRKRARNQASSGQNCSRKVAVKSGNLRERKIFLLSTNPQGEPMRFSLSWSKLSSYFNEPVNIGTNRRHGQLWIPEFG